MFNESIIKKTNQWRKANLAFWGIVSGGIIMLVELTNFDNKELAIILVPTELS